MNTRQKLEVIQKRLGLTQTKLAEKFGVSFVAFNSWWKNIVSEIMENLDIRDQFILKLTYRTGHRGNSF